MTLAGIAALALLAAGAQEPADPVDPVENVRVDYGGSARARAEWWGGFLFGDAPKPDDGFVVTRLLVHADLRYRDRVRLFAELKSAHASDRELPGGARPVDADFLDLHQGFVDVTVAGGGDRSRVVLRLGRQALKFGRQRLVSPLPWGNALRTWDGIDVRWLGGGWETDAFWTHPVNVRDRQLNEPDPDREFWGAYATRRRDRSVLDLYGLALDRRMASFNGTGGAERRRTLGLRWEQGQGKRRPELEVETAYQFGTLGGERITAWMAAVALHRRQADWPGRPRFSLLVDRASGDGEVGGRVETFNQLFPLGHAYFGIADQVGRQNVAAVALSVAAEPAEKLRVVVTAHLFRRVEAADALYHAGGGVLLPGAVGSSRDSGAEIDAVARWKRKRLTVEVGLARFDPGAFVESVTVGDAVTLAYLQTVFGF